MASKVLIASMVASTLAFAAPAGATVRYFEFRIDGFTDGATVTGSFAGEDADADGTLEQFAAQGYFELSSFSAHFSGNSLVDAHDWTLSDLGLSGLIYAFGPALNGTGGHFGVEGVTAYDGSLLLLGGQASLPGACTGTNTCYSIGLIDNGLVTLDSTTSFAFVTEVAAPPGVPEPESWALMLGGFGLIGTTLRNRRTKVRFA